MGSTPTLATMKKEDYIEYDRSFDLKLKTGVNVTINLYKFKCEVPPSPVFAGCRYFRSDDFWNRVSKKR